MSDWLWLTPVVGPVCLLLAWVAYLRFARWLVTQTGDPASLEHAVSLARAVRKQADASVESPPNEPPGTDVHTP